MVTNINGAEHYHWGEVCDGWRLLNRPDLSVIQERIPPGAGEVRHFHQRARQVFFGLAGNLQIELRGQIFPIGPGDSLEVSPGDAHRVRNAGDVDALFLVISAPTTLGDRTNLEV
jgi:mannose-6-phosphate isomerase-like protein (cupin superfamily)